MLGGPDRIEAEWLHELAHVEGVIHVGGVRDHRRAAVVLPQQTLPVALIVAGHHHPTVHACAPLRLRRQSARRALPLPAAVSPARGPPRRLATPGATSCAGRRDALKSWAWLQRASIA